MNQRIYLTRGAGRVLQAVVATGILSGGGAIGGCSSIGVVTVDPTIEHHDVAPFIAARNVDKIDLLLMIDNSRSMADKQAILDFAVPDLVKTLLTPKCVDDTGLPTPTQPGDVLASCPPGAHRATTPITDIHIGIISSSLGGHGADTCSVNGDTQSCPGAPNPSNNDAAHLISRQNACAGGEVPTYQNKGFLAWDPAQNLSPPGEGEAGAIAVDGFGNATTVTPGLVPTLKDMVRGVGQAGCGFTSQLESWYRFLVDPDPYQTITVENGKATPQGTDTLLLKQRADFLRPSSLLTIVMLTDSNDCSIKESGQFYYAAQQQSPTTPGMAFHLPRARQECATNPEDPCCKSCGQSAPKCPADDLCTTSPTLTEAEDPVNLRCFDQKRRFGIDFLYPVERYSDALQSPTVPNRQGDLVPNPIFSDLNLQDDDHRIRDKSLVFLSGIVGVPWQDLARDITDLTKGFKNAEELAMKDSQGHTAWDTVLGDPENHILPMDPHMIESVTPRSGIPGPTAATGTDPINGHDYTASDDLQYACVFGLPAPRDCSVPGVTGCDCGPGNDNPLCDPAAKTTQLRAKAYPGLRELATLKSLNNQGLVASICPTQLTDATRADYGYRQAVTGILDRLTSTTDGQCFPRELTPDAQGLVDCTIIEARDAGPACTCDPTRARRGVKQADQSFLADIKASSFAKDAGWNCFCELIEAGDPVDSTPQELAACVGDPGIAPVIHGGSDDGKGANGWCYVDPSRTPAANPDIVKSCPQDQHRLIRFAGDTMAASNSELFITCASH